MFIPLPKVPMYLWIILISPYKVSYAQLPLHRKLTNSQSSYQNFNLFESTLATCTTDKMTKSYVN